MFIGCQFIWMFIGCQFIRKSIGHRFVTNEAVTNVGRVTPVGVNYQVGPVTRPIISTSQSLKNRKAVWFTRDCCGVCPEENFHYQITGDYIPLKENRGLF